MRSLSLLFLFALLPLWALDTNTYQFAAERGKRLSDITYDINLEFQPKADGFSGSVEVEFNLNSPNQDLYLDYIGHRLLNLQVNGLKVDVAAYDKDRGAVHLEAQHLKEGKNRVHLQFENPYAADGRGMTRFIDPSDDREYLYTDLEPNHARKIFPCFDQPDLKAQFQLSIAIPEHWVAVSNTFEKKSRRDSGRREVLFQVGKPMPTYLFNITVGPYAMWQDNNGTIPMRIFCRQALADQMNATAIFEITRKGMDFLESYLDMAYPYGKYDQTFVPEYAAGAMENPGSIIFNESFLTQFDLSEETPVILDQTIFHELAHQWFGNYMTPGWWDDLWISEATASYLEWVLLEELGYNEPWMAFSGPLSRVMAQDRAPSIHGVRTDVPDLVTADFIFNAVVYEKGMGIMRQLDFSLGGNRYRDGLRTFLKNGTGRSRYADFVDAFDQVSRDDMDRWFQEWVRTPGHNQVALSYEVRRDKIRDAVLRQESVIPDGPLRAHKMRIALVYKQDIRVIDVTYDGAETKLRALNGADVPDFIVLNYQNNDFVGTRFDQRSLQWLKTHIAEVQPPLREVVQQRLWSNFENGELAARDYLAMATKLLENGIFGIEDYQTAKRINEIYVAWINDAHAQQAWFDFLKGRSENENDPMSPLWLSLLIEVSQSREQMDYLYETVLSHTDMSPVQHRRLLIHLIRAGYPRAMTMSEMGEDNEALLKLSEELRRWNPDLESKQALWQTILAEEGYASYDELAQILYQDNRPDLAEPFISPFFQRLDALVAAKKMNHAVHFVQSLFPGAAGAPALEQTRRYLDATALPFPVQTVLRLEADKLEVFLRVRAAHRKAFGDQLVRER